MNAPAPAPVEPTRRPRRSARRRKPLWVLTWLGLAALTCFLIAVAAGLISDKVSSSTTTVTDSAVQPSTGRPSNQWQHPATYVGRYRLNVVPASTGTGATTTGGSRSHQVSGSLMLFLRTIKHGEPLALSGILSLSGPSTGEELVYMTDLTSKQGTLHADINGGSYFGPVIGSFSGIRSSADIVGTIALPGFSGLEVRFTRA